MAQAYGRPADLPVPEVLECLADLNAARFRPLTKSAGLSLGDRSCLTLAQRLGVPVLTADRAWSSLSVA